MNISAGRYENVQTGKIFVVLNVAKHTEANYRLVIMHEEDKPSEWEATPETVFEERIIKDKIEATRFRRLGDSQQQDLKALLKQTLPYIEHSIPDTKCPHTPESNCDGECVDQVISTEFYWKVRKATENAS